MSFCIQNNYYLSFIDCSEGEVSLVGGNKTNEGRVEICKDRTWGTVCDKSFDMNDAEVVCEQLLGSSELGLVSSLNKFKYIIALLSCIL